MIKTLRITSITVVVLAAVFVLLSVVYGAASDKKVKELLKEPGALELFRKARVAKTDKNETPPLVEQAELFAIYLDPPVEVKRPRPSIDRPRHEPTPPEPKKDFSVKFDLIGLSYYSAHPERSLALIDEPGKGLVWVTQGSEVGHSVIEQIKEGVVVVQSGGNTHELTIKKDTQAAASAGADSVDTETASRPALHRADARKNRRTPPGRVGRKDASAGKPVSTSSSSSTRGARPSITKPPSTRRTTENRKPPPYNPEESEAIMKKVLEDLAMMQKQVGDKSDAARQGKRKLGTAADDDGGVERMKKLISQLEAMRVTEKEADELGDLGRKLDDARSDPNRPRGGGGKVEKASDKNDTSATQ